MDRVVAELAWQISKAVGGRISLVDALIAETARAAGAVLVHRDPRMGRIPCTMVEQLVLPQKQ